jgi:hypothetical protein
MDGIRVPVERQAFSVFSTKKEKLLFSQGSLRHESRRKIVLKLNRRGSRAGVNSSPSRGVDIGAPGTTRSTYSGRD